MTTVQIKITQGVLPAQPIAPTLYEVRCYGDPFMVKMMGLDTEFINTGNFQNVVLATVKLGVVNFGAVSQYQPLDSAAVQYLYDIQTADIKTVKQKVDGWLGIGVEAGRPYMLKNGVNTWGTMVWGGTKIQLQSDANGKPYEWVFKGWYQQEDKTKVAKHDIVFVKPVFFRRSDMGRPLAELIAECKIVRATEAWRNNVFNDTPQGGIIWSPLWSPEDWRVNNGASELYLAKEFLLP